MSKKTAQFRSALSGYNRKDVNEFILRQDTELTKKDEELAALKQALQEAKNALAAEEEARRHLENELHELEKKLDESAATAGIPGEPGDGNGVFDKMTNRIGTLLINASAAAETMKDAARAEAKEIRDKASADAEAIRARIRARAGSALDRLTTDIKTATGDSLREAIATLSEIRTETDELVKKIQEKCREVDQKIDFFSVTSHEDIAGKIDALSLSDADNGDGNR